MVPLHVQIMTKPLRSGWQIWRDDWAGILMHYPDANINISRYSYSMQWKWELEILQFPCEPHTTLHRKHTFKWAQTLLCTLLSTSQIYGNKIQDWGSARATLLQQWWNMCSRGKITMNNNKIMFISKTIVRFKNTHIISKRSIYTLCIIELMIVHHSPRPISILCVKKASEIRGLYPGVQGGLESNSTLA